MGRWWWLVMIGVVGVPMAVLAQRPQPHPVQRLRCESLNGRYTLCPVEVRGRVHLERQLSRAACIEGRTWGVNDQGIWVDQGCRGLFLVKAGPLTLTCRSVNFKYQFCRVDTQGGVRLQRQLSRTRCVEGHTWGYDRQGIWVDRGCGAEFVVGLGETLPPFGVERFIRCESVNRQRVWCPVETRRAMVTLERQLSRAPCIQGQTWGVDGQGIWVTDGCRGEFRVSGGTWQGRP